jgi:hypothetical protein
VSECDSLPAFSPAHRDRVRSRGRNGQLPSFAIEILHYLRDHPEAQDTLEGIMVWWVSECAIKHWLPQVRASLAVLVARGKRAAGDGHVSYRLERSGMPHEGGSRK